MIVEALQDESQAFELYANAVPASVIVTAKKPNGTTLVTGSGTVDSVSTTVASVTSQSELEVADATGLVEGRWYIITGGGNEVSRVLVEDVSGTTVKLARRAHFDVSAADSLRGCRVSYTLAADYTGTRGTRYQLQWDVTTTAGDLERHATLYSVCRMRFKNPVSAASARHYVASVGASLATRWSDATQEWVQIANRANRMVRRKLLASQRFPHLLGDEDLWEDAGQTALQIVLTEYGLRPTESEPADYRRDLEEQLGEQIDTAIDGGWYDEDDGGDVDDGTETGPQTMRWAR